MVIQSFNVQSLLREAASRGPKLFDMESMKLYIRESYNELLNKVTWPTWTSLNQTTMVVIAGSIIFALIIVVLDFISKLILNDGIYENFAS